MKNRVKTPVLMEGNSQNNKPVLNTVLSSPNIRYQSIGTK
jgi:hypothetical protein